MAQLVRCRWCQRPLTRGDDGALRDHSGVATAYCAMSPNGLGVFNIADSPHELALPEMDDLEAVKAWLDQ